MARSLIFLPANFAGKLEGRSRDWRKSRVFISRTAQESSDDLVIFLGGLWRGGPLDLPTVGVGVGQGR